MTAEGRSNYSTRPPRHWLGPEEEWWAKVDATPSLQAFYRRPKG